MLYSVDEMTRSGKRTQPGFTLAELIVASTLISIVMASVYTAFNSTLRVRRLGEANLHTYQDARIALTVLSRELNCIVGGSEHLFEGEDDQFEFFAVTPPMNVEEGKGPRLMWVQYRYSRPQKALFREEAVVDEPLPLRRRDEDTVDRSRIKLGRKRKFEFATDVLDFEVWYCWVPPPPKRKPGEPPVLVDPIILEENRQGWGLPQGLKVALTLEDPNASSGRTTFSSSITFRGPTTSYKAERLGLAEERSS